MVCTIRYNCRLCINSTMKRYQRPNQALLLDRLRIYLAKYLFFRSFIRFKLNDQAWLVGFPKIEIYHCRNLCYNCTSGSHMLRHYLLHPLPILYLSFRLTTPHLNWTIAMKEAITIANPSWILGEQSSWCPWLALIFADYHPLRNSVMIIYHAKCWFLGHLTKWQNFK